MPLTGRFKDFGKEFCNRCLHAARFVFGKPPNELFEPRLSQKQFQERQNLLIQAAPTEASTVPFEEAKTIFDDPFALTINDKTHSDDERRFVTIGESKTGRLMLVCHTSGDENVRKISARKPIGAKEKIMKTDEMKKEYDFTGGKRGVLFDRVKKKRERKEPIDNLAVCLKAEDFMNLIPRKIYNVKNFDNELIKLTDEAGEEVVYPIRYFLVLTLPAEVENIIEQIAA